MQGTNVKLMKLNPKARLPKYGSQCAAGADLFACLDGESVTVAPNETTFVHTGIALQIPDGLVGLVYARSGLACKRGLAPANKVGVIDSDYRGEIIVALHNHSDSPCKIEDGERIAQIVFTPYVAAKLIECEALDDSERGAGGFGSTGRK